jgi:hypothetical protein
MLEFNNNCGCDSGSLEGFTDPSCPAPSVVTWASIQGKPSCFTPCAHTHVPGDIIGLEAYIQNVEFANAVITTNSIQLTTPSGVLNANLRLSANAGTGYKVPLSILSDGLIGQIPYASGSNAGILNSGDWTTFNNKFNTPSGTIFQYVRGDGSLATFPVISNFVPYTGAIANVNLGVWGLTSDVLTLSQTPVQANAIGRLRWNTTDGTLDLGLKGGNVVLEVGQKEVARVVNKTTPLINLLKANYQVVKIVGATGQRLSVALAQANNDLNSASTLGVVTEDINGNQEGFIVTNGQIKQINTTGSLQGETWVDGEVLYLSPTIPGQLTKVKPIAPQHTVIVGFVEYSHPVNGKIFVKVDNGYELDELHNVRITSPTNGQVLTYDNVLSVWKNQNASTFPSFLVGSVPFGNGTGLTENNPKFFWDNTLFKLKLTDSKLEFLNSSLLGSALLEYKLPNLSSSFTALTLDQTNNNSSGAMLLKLRAYNNTIGNGQITGLVFGTVDGGDTVDAAVGMIWNTPNSLNGNFLILRNTFGTTGIISIETNAYARVDGLALTKYETVDFAVYASPTYTAVMPNNIIRFKFGGAAPKVIYLPANAAVNVPEGYIFTVKAINLKGGSPNVTVSTTGTTTSDVFVFSGTADYESVMYRYSEISNHWDIIAKY